MVIMGNNSSIVVETDLHRALRAAYYAADRKVSALIVEQTEARALPITTAEEQQAKSDKIWDLREDFQNAIGYRDGCRACCVLAGVPGFKD